MNNTPDTNRLQQLATEINILQRQTALGIVEIGRRQIGDGASLKQIANHIAPQVGLEAGDLRSLLIRHAGEVKPDGS